MKILLAEDHDNLREIIEDYLVVHGYVVESFDNGEDAYYSFLTESYDLVLLDVMMPDMDGFAVLKKIRRTSRVPVLMLTARGEAEETPILFITAKVQEVDQLKGYELGCDDYIIKPFSLPVLLAKCNAIMNRKHYKFLEKGILKLNTREKQAYLNNQNLNLKIIDYKILEYFIKNPNQILSREQILLKVWGFDYKGQERSVDTHIKILRKALGTYQKGIKTVIKQGYCFETKVFENG